ncbi:hypothetical protein OPT61_g4065 [Boeremia exigua]|uniref:Uncharacterized protein n=1 Tax=Boeremia exigua TaxID=749465 RepID=A0ACC2IFH2_9PLEO|nr:hypothetical protein OPT61_g4065 [Boeremia exigua]
MAPKAAARRPPLSPRPEQSHDSLRPNAPTVRATPKTDEPRTLLSRNSWSKSRDPDLVKAARTGCDMH